MHNSAVADVQLKAEELIGCACDYREGSPKKESTVAAGL